MSLSRSELFSKYSVGKMEGNIWILIYSNSIWVFNKILFEFNGIFLVAHYKKAHLTPIMIPN